MTSSITPQQAYEAEVEALNKAMANVVTIVHNTPMKFSDTMQLNGDLQMLNAIKDKYLASIKPPVASIVPNP